VDRDSGTGSTSGGLFGRMLDIFLFDILNFGQCLAAAVNFQHVAA
jgi:hypothetical protein